MITGEPSVDRPLSARKRMGFVEYGSHVFSFGSGEHTDLMMLRQLPPSRDTSVSQVLRGVPCRRRRGC